MLRRTPTLLLVLLTIAFAVPASTVAAYTWGTVATVSDTNANRVCVGYPNNQVDITCPSYAPSLTTAGDISVSGALQATRLLATGVSATNITVTNINGLPYGTSNAQGDRIVSNSQAGVIANSTGFVSITTGGVTGTTYFNTAGVLVGPGISATGTVSATRYYAAPISGLGAPVSMSGSNVPGGNDTNVQYKSGGALAGSDSFKWNSGTSTLIVTGTVSATNFVGDGSGLTGVVAGTSDRIVSGSVSAIAQQTSGTVKVSGTLALINTGNETCDANKVYSLRVHPTLKMLQVCVP